MTLYKNRYRRETTRLKGHNYSDPAAYFITLLTENRKRLFGNIVDGTMVLSEFGELVKENWLKTPFIRPYVELDEFVLMPDHFRAIVIITSQVKKMLENEGQSELCINRETEKQKVGDKRVPVSPSHTLGAIIRGYKAATTKSINIIRNTPGKQVWKRDYHDHIIRSEVEFDRIRSYIINNPAKYGM